MAEALEKLVVVMEKIGEVLERNATPVFVNMTVDARDTRTANQVMKQVINAMKGSNANA